MPSVVNIVDEGAIGTGLNADAATNTTAISNAITAAGSGGTVYVPTGTYVIDSEIAITSVAGLTFRGDSQGTATVAMGSTIKAKSGFSGAMFRTQVASGENGTMVRDLRFDANSEAGVTTIIDIPNNETVKTYFNDVLLRGAPIGVRMVGSNYDTLYFDRIVMSDVDTCFDCSGTSIRLMVVSNSRLVAHNRVVILGADNTTSGDKCAFVKFENNQMNVVGAPTEIALIRNAEVVVFRDNWIEVDSGISTAPVNAMLVLGTASSRPESVFIHGNRFQGNSVADYAIGVVNSLRPRVRDNYGTSINTRFIESLDAATFGQAQGNPAGGSGLVVSDPTGWSFVQGNSSSSEPQYATAFRMRLPTTGVGFGVQEGSDTNDRIAIRTDGLIRLGSGSAAFDVELSRKAANVLGLATGDVFRHNSGVTASRPSASAVGAGAEWFDTTLGKPIWSNGTNWVDATGATV